MLVSRMGSLGKSANGPIMPLPVLPVKSEPLLLLPPLLLLEPVWAPVPEEPVVEPLVAPLPPQETTAITGAEQTVSTQAVRRARSMDDLPWWMDRQTDRSR
jgi:hypothetical protein